MDLLWLDGNRVVTSFEVEATTTMTSALLRGSNLPVEVSKIMVLPEEREADFTRKMDSPLFHDHFEEENWRLVYFDALREAFLKTREKTRLESLVGIKAAEKPSRQVRETNQILLSL